MAETVTVTVLNNRVRNILGNNPSVTDIWLSGEISGLKRSPKGHYYLTLKDDKAQIQAVLFAGARARMDFEPRDNMKVLAFGSVDIYPEGGRYQFIIQNIRQSGIGELYQKYEELKGRLKSEGLFDDSHKRPIPRYPRTIGVVTSATGAVIHDIITTSATRYPADILLAPAMVQGEGAAETIVAGIELLNRSGVDVIIVGRGGGSIEDLWPFNEEIVARAIHASKVPVVSAVGHETDFTIADFVADARAPTPTGAAAMILRDRDELRNQLFTVFTRVERATRTSITGKRRQLEVLSARFSSKGTSNDILMKSMHLDDLWDRAYGRMLVMLKDGQSSLKVADATLSPEATLRRIVNLGDRVDSIDRRITDIAVNRLELAKVTFKGLEDHLDAVDPRNVLERGYSMVRGADGRIITTVDSMDEGEHIRIIMHDGSAEAVVERKVKE